MDNICKQYIKQIKAMFPVIGKDEKKYIEKLIKNVEEFSADENVTDIKQLYSNYGAPAEVVAQYFSNVNMDYILKKLKIRKYVKSFIIVAIVILVAVSTMFSIFAIQNHEMSLREEAVICEEEITILEHSEVEETAPQKTTQSVED